MSTSGISTESTPPRRVWLTVTGLSNRAIRVCLPGNSQVETSSENWECQGAGREIGDRRQELVVVVGSRMTKPIPSRLGDRNPAHLHLRRPRIIIAAAAAPIAQREGSGTS